MAGIHQQKYNTPSVNYFTTLWYTLQSERFVFVTKIRNPLFSIKASGSLAKTMSFVKRLGQPIVEKKPEIPDAKSLAQLSWRHMYLKAVALWHALSAAEKQEWESLARRRHMTGYAWFMSQCLKPNPGIYLPLQGGIMSGDIDMNSHSILDLPAPSVDQEAATKKYVDDAEARATYTEGCFCYRTDTLSVPHNTGTGINWTHQEYDTDEIHHPAAEPQNLTCKTPGIYLVNAYIVWAPNAVGFRLLNIENTIAPWLRIRHITWGNADVQSTNQIVRLITLALNQKLYLTLVQTSGGALDVWCALERSHFSMQRVG